MLEASEHVGGTRRGRARSPASGSTSAATGCTRRSRRGCSRSCDRIVELQERPTHGRVRWATGRCRSPLTQTGLLRGLPAGTGGAAAVDAAPGPLRRPAGRQLRRGRPGRARRRRCGASSTSRTPGSSGAPTRRCSPASRPPPGDRLVTDRHRPPPAGAHRSTPTFLYPRRGFGAIAEALAEPVPVDTGRRVNRIIEHPDRVIVGLSDGRLVTASHVHATLPAWQVASWLGLHEEPSGPPPVRAMVLVYLVLDRRPYTTFDAHYLPDRHRAADPGLGADEPPGQRRRTRPTARSCAPSSRAGEGDDVWTAPRRLRSRLRVADDLVRSGLPDPRPVEVHVERLASVHPVMTPQSLAALARAERALTLSRRVTVLGRPGPRHVGQHAPRAAAGRGVGPLRPPGRDLRPRRLGCRPGGVPRRGT